MVRRRSWLRFAAARLRLRGDRLPGPDRGGEPRSTFRIIPYLLPLFVLMLRMTGALGLGIPRRILQLRILRGIWRRRLARCGRHDHARAVAQAVCAVDHNLLTDRHAGIDRCHWAIGRADIDRSDRHPVVGVDYVDVTSRCAALDGGGGTVTTLCSVFTRSCALTN
jgi:hypothetical protein